MNFLLTQVLPHDVSVKRKFLIVLILFMNFLNCWCQKYSWCDPQLCGGSTSVRHIACRNYGVGLVLKILSTRRMSDVLSYIITLNAKNAQ